MDLKLAIYFGSEEQNKAEMKKCAQELIEVFENLDQFPCSPVMKWARSAQVEKYKELFPEEFEEDALETDLGFFLIFDNDFERLTASQFLESAQAEDEDEEYEEIEIWCSCNLEECICEPCDCDQAICICEEEEIEIEYCLYCDSTEECNCEEDEHEDLYSAELEIITNLIKEKNYSPRDPLDLVHFLTENEIDAEEDEITEIWEDVLTSLSLQEMGF